MPSHCMASKVSILTSKGLGRGSCGRVEPVDIVILPSGKSLDVCAQLREAKKLKNALGEPIGKKKKKSKQAKMSTKEGVDVFEFLNKKVLQKGMHFLYEEYVCVSVFV